MSDRRDRLERIASRSAPRSPAELGDRPAAGLVARAQQTDRAARFAERRARVQAQHEAQQRRARARDLALDGAAVVAGLVGATVVGVLVGNGAVGVVVGVVAVAAGLVGRRLVARLARRRGASAWDWRAGRYRLLGTPAAEVQRRDEPPPTDGPPRRPS